MLPAVLVAWKKRQPRPGQAPRPGLVLEPEPQVDRLAGAQGEAALPEQRPGRGRAAR
ncbi:MAG: hypothetical protein KF878_21405 [Planctomycetes bacterium]|nr:hypothetical protein [Planctomycetota bacterium]